MGPGWTDVYVRLPALIVMGVIFLVAAALPLFRSFRDSLMVLLALPLATIGGMVALRVLNDQFDQFQPLDLLTMIGFIILLGLVVNNAILLVHQTLLHVREDGMDSVDAIVMATRNRIRPIFMSTLTSIFGMLPLVVFPGAGSELYRGLGSVVVGGLSLSAVLTLVMIPPILAILVPLLERGRGGAGSSLEAAAAE